VVTPTGSASLPPEDEHKGSAKGEGLPDRGLPDASARTARTRLDRDLVEREILNQLVRDLTGFTASPALVLERLAHAARRMALATGTCVLQVVGETYEVVAASGNVLPFVGQQFVMMPAPSLFRDVIASLRPMFTNSGETDARIDPRFREPLGIRQAAVAPIIIDGAVTGLLLCVNTGHGAFTYDDMSSLQRLADHTALALHSARLMRAAELSLAEANSKAAEAMREGRHLSVLARMASVLANALTREDLYAGLMCIIEENLGGAGCSIYDTDANKRTARLEFQAGLGNVHPDAVAASFWITRLGHVVDTGQPLFVTDLGRNSNEPEMLLNEPLRREGIGSVAALPLVIGDRPRGLLAVRYRGRRDFDDAEQRLLTGFAAQVAVALRHVGYFADLELRARRLTALAEAQQLLSRFVSRESLLPAIADAVSHVVPAAEYDLFFSASGALRCVYSTRYGKAVPAAQGATHDLELARATYGSGVPRIGVAIAGAVTNGRRTVELCAPIRFGERSIGVLRLRTAGTGTFDLQDLDLISILARHAGSALETARLFRAQDVERQRAEAAADLARAVLRAEKFNDGAARLIAVIDRVVPSSGKALGIARGRDGRIEYVAASGTLELLLGHRPPGTSGVDAASPDGRPFEVASLRHLAPADILESVPNEWAFVVPLIARDRTLGVILVSMPQGARLDQTARTTVERLSASLALACDALLLDEEERFARERERMLATALTTMNQPVFILDRQHVRYANPAATLEYGWSLAELSMMTLAEIISGGPGALRTADHHGSIPDVLDGDLGDSLHRRRDGSEFPAAVTRNAIASADGGLVGHVVSVRNMSAEHEVAAQMRHAEKMVALGELVAGVAHEINNPLTGISAFAQLLLEEPLTADQRESVKLIKRESDRAATVIRDLLLFGRKEGASSGPVDINALLEQTVRLRAYQLRNANVEVTLLLDPATPHVLGDGQKLQQVLLNVIVNAEHAMQGSDVARLLLRTTQAGDRIGIEATDTGIGMSAAESQRIFEPFYTTKPAGVGTGLGLSVSYGIIQAHHGVIEARSEPGVGTTILIELPAATRPGLFDGAAMEASV
jgi:two-component system NtrC family sensor kinase